MGKHKKHKRPSQEPAEHEGGLQVVFKLPIAPTRPQWVREQAPSLHPSYSHKHHHSSPRELLVSIPFSLLRASSVEEEVEEVGRMREELPSAPEHRHHKHKKHKHKKHRQSNQEPVAMETQTIPAFSVEPVPRLVLPTCAKVPSAKPELVATVTTAPEHHVHKHKHRKHRHGSPHRHHRKPHTTGLQAVVGGGGGTEGMAYGAREPMHGTQRIPHLGGKTIRGELSSVSGVVPGQAPGAVPGRAPVALREGHRKPDDIVVRVPKVQPPALIPDGRVEGGEEEGGGHKSHKKKKKKHKHKHRATTNHPSLIASDVPADHPSLSTLHAHSEHSSLPTSRTHSQHPSLPTVGPPEPPSRPTLRPPSDLHSLSTPQSPDHSTEPLPPPRHHQDSWLLPPSPKRVKFETLPPADLQRPVELPQANHPSQSKPRSQIALKAPPSSITPTTIGPPTPPIPSCHTPSPPPVVEGEGPYPAHTNRLPVPKVPQVRLSESTLKFFLKNLHHQIQRRDTQDVFAEPVTEDIAPGYSQMIPFAMDLTTMAAKVESNKYPSVNEFKDDFVLMCNNAMTYNAPDTMYYGIAKNLLTSGLKIIAKETSLRPDIRYGKLSTRSNTASPLPLFHLPPPTNVELDYSSPFICRLDITALKSIGGVSSSIAPVEVVGDEEVKVEVEDQSYLTKVCVGVEAEESATTAPAEDILTQVCEAAEEVKENLDSNKPDAKFCFINTNEHGKTMLNLLNPDCPEVCSSKPVNLSELSRRAQLGIQTAAVLRSELNIPMLKATPVTCLMYGPFGSFAPAYDSSFATVQKMDPELLLSSYGSELGVSYAHSLQQFVKGAPSFVCEMADAVLNGLTNSRHGKFKETLREKERERAIGKVEDRGEQQEGGEGGRSDSPTALDSGGGEGRLTGEATVSSQATSESVLGPKRQESAVPALHIGDCLSATSGLLSELHHAQLERLVQPPGLSDTGHFILSPPSIHERETASKLTQELAVLTSQVRPQDLVSAPALQTAMGISLDAGKGRTTDSIPLQ